MATFYVTSNADFDHAVRSLHDTVTTITKAHPGKVQGDAHLIFEDVCALIEHLLKVEPFPVRDRDALDSALLAFLLLCRRIDKPQLAQAAE